MKLHLNSFKCQFDESTEMVTVIDDTNFRHLIHSESIMWHEFNPDFVNEAMDEFVFRIQDEKWDELVNKIYFNSDVKIVLNEIETPEDFDIYQYFSSNSHVIQYILFPKDRNKTFLMQSETAISGNYFIKTMHTALSNPKESKINSLYKLKMFWNSLGFHRGQNEFSTHQRSILKWFANHFTFIYCWLFDNAIGKFKIAKGRLVPTSLHLPMFYFKE